MLERLDPAAVVREVLVLEEATERMTNEIPAGFAVRADHEFLVRALGNLIRNALAYAGSHGPIRILGGPHLDRFRLIVQDTGPGLPETDLESVFAPFYRLDTGRTPGSGGVGLGLSIVRNCIASCGGSVHCRNRAAAGLEVVVDLPLAGAPEAYSREHVAGGTDFAGRAGGGPGGGEDPGEPVRGLPQCEDETRRAGPELP
ncbi:MAG: sensor histidine kinase [Acidobacteriota bacterium]